MIDANNKHFGLQRSVWKSRLACCASAFSFLAMMPATAHAQSTGAAAESSNDGEILVTARRRSESLQNVPLSVSALGSDYLERINATTLSDIQRAIPGLSYVERGNLQTEITIRGIGGDARNPGVDSGVGFYIDGAYVPRTSGFNSDLSEVGSIEILRGPQGTLFGKNTIAGVINITTKKPTAETEGMLFASYGRFNSFKTQASLSGALAEGLYAKVTTATWDRDGYIENIVRDEKLNDENRRGGRIQLRYNPGNALDVNLSIDGTRDRRRGVLNQVTSGIGFAGAYYTGDRFIMNSDQRNSDSRDMWGATLGIDYTLGNGTTLTSISAYRKIDLLIYSDVDQTPADLFRSGPFTDETEMVSQELRITSPSDRPLRYVAGVFFYHQNIVSERTIFVNGVVGYDFRGQAATDSYAAFASVDYDVMDSLTLTGGLRYGTDDKGGNLFQRRTGLNYDLDLNRKDKNLSWTASMLYKIDPRHSVYATVSRGFKAGGFNLDTPGVANLTPIDLNFRPEKVTNYEVGVKGSFGPILRYTIAGFHIDYKDKQVSQFLPAAAGSIPIFATSNAGQAKIDGFEASVESQPVEGLRISSAVSYLNAKYFRFDNAAQVNGAFVSFTGNRIERTPRWSATGDIEYEHQIGTAKLFVGGGISYTGSLYFQPDNAARNFQKPYTLLDARAGIRKGDITLTFWGRNITGKEYLTFNRQFSGSDQGVYGEPATYGVDVRYRF